MLRSGAERLDDRPCREEFDINALSLSAWPLCFVGCPPVSSLLPPWFCHLAWPSQPVHRANQTKSFHSQDMEKIKCGAAAKWACCRTKSRIRARVTFCLVMLCAAEQRRCIMVETRIRAWGMHCHRRESRNNTNQLLKLEYLTGVNLLPSRTEFHAPNSARKVQGAQRLPNVIFARANLYKHQSFGVPSWKTERDGAQEKTAMSWCRL